MSILVNPESRIMVQGITGAEGHFHTRSMLSYGTNIVAGVTPGKGGQTVEGIPVYDKVTEAITQHRPDVAIIFVPARAAKSAVIESIDSGIKLIIIITEGIPLVDEIEFIARAAKVGSIIIGPNCPGIIAPSLNIEVGILPQQIFQPGGVGIVSRSGTLTYEIAWQISNAGAGQSTCVGIGGDPIRGLDFVQALEMYKEDPETWGVVLVGEVGGNAEEMAAQYIERTEYPKPVVAYIAGKTAPVGKRMGHAGAIIMGNTGTAESKVKAFDLAGIPVAAKPSEIIRLLRE